MKRHATHCDLERDREDDGGETRAATRIRRDERDEHVNERRIGAGKATVESHERALEADGEKDRELEIGEDREIARAAESPPDSRCDEDAPQNERGRERDDGSGRAAEHDERGQDRSETEAARTAETTSNEERCAHEGIHRGESSRPYQRASETAKFVGRIGAPAFLPSFYL